MRIFFLLIFISITVYGQVSLASNLLITDYKYPFKNSPIVKMRLADICDENKLKNTITSRGIPKSSPQYSMMVNMLTKQCDQAKQKNLKDSISYMIKGKSILEIFDPTISSKVSIFEISLREYGSKQSFVSAWKELQKLKNINSNNNDYILTKGAYNTSVGYTNINNIVIQTDLMLSKGDTVKSLDNFMKKYTKWLKLK